MLYKLFSMPVMVRNAINGETKTTKQDEPINEMRDLESMYCNERSHKMLQNLAVPIQV